MNWRESVVENYFFTQLTLHFESNTPIVDHKNHFFDNGRKWISLFIWTGEHDCDSMEYNELLMLKWKYSRKFVIWKT